MGDITENFSAWEFACPCGECDSTGHEMSKRFVDSLQKIRDDLDAPIKINSGFRCRNHHDSIYKKLGKTAPANSMHLIGRAVDIACPTNQYRYDLIDLACENLFYGIGIGETFVHLDTRPRLRRRVWLYS